MGQSNMLHRVTSKDILFCHSALCVQEFPHFFGGVSSTLTYGPSSGASVGSPERAAPLRLHEDASRSGHLRRVHCGRMEFDYLQIRTSENTQCLVARGAFLQSIRCLFTKRPVKLAAQTCRNTHAPLHISHILNGA